MGDWLAQVTSCEWQNRGLNPECFLPEPVEVAGKETALEARFPSGVTVANRKRAA